MKDPKSETDKNLRKVYKTCQEIEKCLEEEIGVNVGWVTFSLKRIAMETINNNDFEVTKVTEQTILGDSPIKSVQRMCATRPERNANA